MGLLDIGRLQRVSTYANKPVAVCDHALYDFKNCFNECDEGTAGAMHIGNMWICLKKSVNANNVDLDIIPSDPNGKLKVVKRG